MSAALRALARRARRDRGCIGSEVYESVDDPNRIFLHAEWIDADGLERYVTSDDFTQVLTLMEMAASPPVLEIHFGGETRGLDYVAELRRSVKPNGE
jgi:quinol monooxygenase YgiN